VIVGGLRSMLMPLTDPVPTLPALSAMLAEAPSAASLVIVLLPAGSRGVNT